MDPEERRLILDRAFDRAMETVLGAFLDEGFTVSPVGAGNLHRSDREGHGRRYAMLDAALPEQGLRSREASEPPALCKSRVSMFELTGSCTLLTVEKPTQPYSELATLVPQLSERIGHVLRALLRAGTLNAA